MKMMQNRFLAILSASAVLAVTGIASIESANAGHERSFCGTTSIYAEARFLDVQTDRLHSSAKRELRYHRSHGHKLLKQICSLEERADHLRSAIENRRSRQTVLSLACSVKESADRVVAGLRRCDVSPRLLRFACMIRERAADLHSSLKPVERSPYVEDYREREWREPARPVYRDQRSHAGWSPRSSVTWRFSTRW